MRESLRDAVYKRLKEEITSGKRTPGERLLEVKLVEQFNASRSPVREALRLLEAEGLITFERNKGITIAKLSPKEVNEIYDLRCLLESYAARLSAQAATSKDIAYLESLQSKLRTAAKNLDSNEWLPNNALFHNFFCEHCGNDHLIRIVDNLKRRVFRYYYITASIPWHFDLYLEHHDVMLLGCKQNDGEIAEKYMRLHLETIQEVLVSRLNVENSNYV
jgi:DNA-binding GntR family transcriptional regulator